MRYLLLLLLATAAGAQTLVIQNVTAVDANGTRPNVTVLVRDGWISSAGPGVRVPQGARVVSGKGKFLIPGLWDMHVHLWEKEPMVNLYLATGVLGLRDMGSDLPRTRALRTEIAAGRVPGPALIYTSGPPVDGPESNLTQTKVITVADSEAARRATDTVDEGLADFVKVMSSLSEDAYLALAQRARVRRIPFAGHLPEAVDVSTAIDARQKSIEHLFGMALAGSLEEPTLRRRRAAAIAKNDFAALHEVRDRTYATFNPAIAAEIFRRMSRFGVWQTPTLGLRKRLSFIGLDDTVNARELRYVPAAVRDGWQDPRVEGRKASAEQLTSFREDYEFHRRLVGHMYRAGTGILAGTDTGDAYVVPGFALHDELHLLTEAGMTTHDALGAATLQPARYFGLEDRHGTVAVGRAANLILLDADPSADIRNTRRIAAVVAKGKLLERPCLDRLLTDKNEKCGLAADQAEPTRPPAAKPVRRKARRR
ncbi:MAG TPA: amidohydrolase family protein [Bryobacteraceae bacterium]|nr:amidohydrolase family protein [Bryobacteraceae bacterium]